jgi:hypothetical protein
MSRLLYSDMHSVSVGAPSVDRVLNLSWARMGCEVVFPFSSSIASKVTLWTCLSVVPGRVD